YSYLYKVESSSYACAEMLAKHIDSESFKAFITINKLPDTVALRGRVNSPIEAGGHGILPYYDLFPYLFNRVATKAKPFLIQRQLPIVQCAPATLHTNIIAAWHAAFKDKLCAIKSSNIPLSETLFLRKSNYLTWQTLWPTNRLTTIEDRVYLTSLSIINGNLDRPDRACPLTGMSFKRMTPLQYTEHVFSCVKCVRRGAWLRHEEVVQTLVKTFKFYNVITHIPPSGMFPRPENRKGGTDLLVYGALHTWHIDVKVSKSVEGMTRLFKLCLNSYEQFEHVYNFITVPFVMSIHGHVYSQTLNLLEQMIRDFIATSSSLKSAIVANCQCAVLRGVTNGLQYVGLSFDTSPVDMDDDDPDVTIPSYSIPIAAGGVTAVPTSSLRTDE
ncbi:MAG TPA: hypothetical protein VEF04_19845, partial [Blastocatellia bacterium]|nr:hypothetical protein [Blastocatellia bacterium]